jgi:hypothetical protein
MSMTDVKGNFSEDKEKYGVFHVGMRGKVKKTIFIDVDINDGDMERNI